jgi:hypothetical protein
LHNIGRVVKQKLHNNLTPSTIRAALSYGVTDVDSLINLHSRLHEKALQLEPVRLPEHIPNLKRYEPNFIAYDKCLGKAGVKGC